MKKTVFLCMMLLVNILFLPGCSNKNTAQLQTGENPDGAIAQIPHEDTETAPIDATLPLPQSSVSQSPETAFYDLQHSVDSGYQSWRVSPLDVALDFATQSLYFEGSAALSGDYDKELARVVFTKETGEEIHIDLYQPATKGAGGIWAVDCWFDENHKLHQVRDLAALPPLFYNDSNVPDAIKQAIRSVVVKDWEEVFGAYYNVLGFYAQNVSYSATDDAAEVQFLLTIVTQNFYKDPDTVAYIKQAKESNSASYQQLYDEYNMPKSGSVDLKVTMALDDTREVLLDTIQVFNNIGVHGEDEYVPAKAIDFIIKE